MTNRPETGPMEFEGDWPGVFIRGDNAFGMVSELEVIISFLEGSPLMQSHLREVSALLTSCLVGNGKDPRDLIRLKEYGSCVRSDGD